MHAFRVRCAAAERHGPAYPDLSANGATGVGPGNGRAHARFAVKDPHDLTPEERRVTSSAPAAARTAVGLRSERGPVLFAVMLCTGLVALDSTIIATAVPSVVAGLGGFAQFPWLFSIYLLTQAVTVPL